VDRAGKVGELAGHLGEHVLDLELGCRVTLVDVVGVGVGSAAGDDGKQESGGEGEQTLHDDVLSLDCSMPPSADCGWESMSPSADGGWESMPPSADGGWELRPQDGCAARTASRKSIRCCWSA